MIDDKRTDEGWKEKAQREKKEPEKEYKVTEVNFATFISSLVIQAMILLGEVENPVTKRTEENLEQASFLIDTLGMLKEKTKGNLTQEELKLLEDVLYDLRMRYVNRTKKG